MYDFKSVKSLYEDGYRCIYYDKYEENPLVYLKNFENEDSKEVQFQNKEQFMEFKDYMEQLRSK